MSNNICNKQLSIKTRIIRNKLVMCKYRHTQKIGQKYPKICKNLNWKPVGQIWKVELVNAQEVYISLLD